MRIKIISDGTVTGTKIVNAETNEEVELVQEITWKVGLSHQAAIAVVQFAAVEVELEADVEN